MKMLEIAALPNGAHRNQTFHGILPDGWAVIPDDMELENFPFGIVTAEEVKPKHNVETVNDDGEVVAEQEPCGVMTVTGWKPLPMPEVKPEEPKPTQLDTIEAQVTYTAMMTDTLLGG